jgi:hypothetical protein
VKDSGGANQRLPEVIMSEFDIVEVLDRAGKSSTIGDFAVLDGDVRIAICFGNANAEGERI